MSLLKRDIQDGSFSGVTNNMMELIKLFLEQIVFIINSPLTLIRGLFNNINNLLDNSQNLPYLDVENNTTTTSNKPPKREPKSNENKRGPGF